MLTSPRFVAQVDLPTRVYRDTLMSMYGAGEWALVPTSELQLRGRTFSREWALLVNGGSFVRYVVCATPKRPFGPSDRLHVRRSVPSTARQGASLRPSSGTLHDG